MAKLDLVYIGKFTIKDLSLNSFYRYKEGEISFEDITRDNIKKESQNLLDRCEYAVFVEGYKKKVLKKISLI